MKEKTQGMRKRMTKRDALLEASIFARSWVLGSILKYKISF